MHISIGFFSLLYSEFLWFGWAKLKIWDFRPLFSLIHMLNVRKTASFSYWFITLFWVIKISIYLVLGSSSFFISCGFLIVELRIELCCLTFSVGNFKLMNPFVL